MTTAKQNSYHFLIITLLNILKNIGIKFPYKTKHTLIFFRRKVQNLRNKWLKSAIKGVMAKVEEPLEYATENT